MPPDVGAISDVIGRIRQAGAPNGVRPNNAGVNGSFTTAGAVVDQNLQVAMNRAGPAASQAASDAQAKVADAAR